MYHSRNMYLQLTILKSLHCTVYPKFQDKTLTLYAETRSARFVSEQGTLDSYSVKCDVQNLFHVIVYTHFGVKN